MCVLISSGGLINCKLDVLYRQDWKLKPQCVPLLALPLFQNPSERCERNKHMDRTEYKLIKMVYVVRAS